MSTSHPIQDPARVVPALPFYVTGGTLRADAPSYVERKADRDLFGGLMRGEFCYVLTSRQMGKSSLMVRTARKLRERGLAVVVLDLTAIGQNLTPEQWFDGLMHFFARQLCLEEELDEFWRANERLGPCQRFFTGLREVVLPKLGQRTDASPENTGKLVIFVDELDTVRSLPFSTDEFFAAIRECYTRRTEDSEFERLTFCLLGVATPSDLIRDTRMTPFNIGRRIELHDFTEEEALPLARGLKVSPGDFTSPAPSIPVELDLRAREVLHRIFHWTGGHPYLTQRLCNEVATANNDGNALNNVDSAVGVDRLCAKLFLNVRAKEHDDNLLFVRERLLRSDLDLAGLLSLYLRVRHHGSVPDEETNPLVSGLLLAGIVRAHHGQLRVRNRIYAYVFDDAWVRANMPDAELRRQREAFRSGLRRGAAVVAAIALVGVIGSWLVRGQLRAREAQRAIENLGDIYERILSYQDRATIRQDMDMSGMKMSMSGSFVTALRKPDRLNLRFNFNTGLSEPNVHALSDGQTLWAYVPGEPEYLEQPARTNLAATLETVTQEFTMQTSSIVYEMMASTRPKLDLLRRAQQIEFAGKGTLHGEDVYILRWLHRLDPPVPTAPLPQSGRKDAPKAPVTAWVRQRDGVIIQTMLDLSTVITNTTMPRADGPGSRRVPLQRLVLTITHEDIRLNEDVPDSHFVFTPADGAEKVSRLQGLGPFGGRSRSRTPRRGPPEQEPKFTQDSLKETIPARDPQAGVQLLDLTGHFNAPLTEPWLVARAGDDLSQLPRGVQIFGGTAFDVRGVVQLGGRAEPYLMRHYPPSVSGMRVGRACQRLHFLHGCGWTADDGTHVANYLVRYADGQERIIPVIYGFDLRNWWPQPNEPAGRGNAPVWAGANSATTQVRLYKTTWENPRPDVAIESIGFASAMQNPAPFLIAITVD